MNSITNPKNGQSILSPFATDHEAHRALVEKINSGNKSEFSLSIEAAFHSSVEFGKPFSAAQRFWLHKLAMPDVAPVSTAKVALDKLSNLFSRIGAKLKRPAVVLALPDGLEMKVSVAGERSRYTGQLMVASPSFGGAYFGRVDKDGSFYPGRDASEAALDLLHRFAADPLAVAAEQGHLTGKCCFCNRKLDNEVSTSLGYGPVCAKKWGLDHKAVKSEAPVRLRRQRAL